MPTPSHLCGDRIRADDADLSAACGAAPGGPAVGLDAEPVLLAQSAARAAWRGAEQPGAHLLAVPADAAPAQRAVAPRSSRSKSPTPRAPAWVQMPSLARTAIQASAFWSAWPTATFSAAPTRPKRVIRR